MKQNAIEKGLPGSPAEATGALEKEISCRATNAVLKYIESLGYDAGVIVEGLPHSREYLTDPFNWLTYDVMETICQRAARLVGDKTVMRRVGLASAGLNSQGGLEHIVRLLGDPRAAYKNVPQYATRLDKVLKLTTSFVGRNEAVITMKLTKNYVPSKSACYYTQGVLASIPTLWGLPPADVEEVQCMCPSGGSTDKEATEYGADACKFRVTWQSVQPWYSAITRIIPKTVYSARSTVKELEKQFSLLEQKNAELWRRNAQLAKVREIALGIDCVRRVDEVLRLVVELARDIPGIGFVVVQRLDESGEMVTAPYYSRLRQQNIIKTLKVVGFDLDEQLGKAPTSGRLQFSRAKSKTAQDYLSNPRVIVKERLADLLDGVWDKDLCDAIQKVIQVKKFIIVPIMIDGGSWGNFVFFLTAEVPVDILEMVSGHCAIAIKNVGFMESLARRNRELDGITATTKETSFLRSGK